MRAAAVGRVVKSNDPAFKENDWVTGTLGKLRFEQSGGKASQELTVTSPLPSAPSPSVNL